MPKTQGRIEFDPSLEEELVQVALNLDPFIWEKMNKKQRAIKIAVYRLFQEFPELRM